MATRHLQICDRCKKEVEVASNETHKIPDGFCHVHLSAYDRDKKPCGKVSVDVCDQCAQALQKAFNTAMDMSPKAAK